MKKRIAIAVAILAILPSGFCDDLNDQANGIFTQIQQLENARLAATSYRAAFESYETAESHLERLLSSYPNSTIAIQLEAGEARISDFTPDQYRSLKPLMQSLANAEKDPFQCAIRVADTIVKGIPKASAFCDIAEKCLKAGQKETAALALTMALDATRTITILKPEDAVDTAAILARISILSSQAGLKEVSAKAHTYAFEATTIFTNKEHHQLALSTIAIEFAKAGEFGLAQEAVEQIYDHYMISITLSEIAGSYIEANRKDDAAQTLDKAQQAAMEISDESHRDQALGKIAVIYAAAGQSAKARETIASIRNTPDNQSVIAETLLMIADQNATAGLFAQALQAAADIPLKGTEAKAYVAIAGQYAKAEMKGEADQTLSRAMETAKTLKSAEQTEIIVLIAEMYAEIGEPAKAMETVKAIQDVTMRPSVSFKVVSRLLEDGKPNLALEASQSIDDTYFKAMAMAETAGAYARMQQNGTAVQLLSEARSIAQSIKETDTRDDALAALANSYAATGQFVEALSETGAIKDPSKQAQALNEIASEHANSNHVMGPSEFDQMAEILIARYPLKLIGK